MDSKFIGKVNLFLENDTGNHWDFKTLPIRRLKKKSE